MKYLMRELRESTGLTQKDFAKQYGIPLSTLRKWEQGEASPAPYVLDLIAGTLPATDRSLRRIPGEEGNFYYYNKFKHTLSDSLGNTVVVSGDLEEVNEQNLRLYVQELFESFYEIRDKFCRDCEYDKTEGIIWTR